MNTNIINMLEDIKYDRYNSYNNYLSNENIGNIYQWFYSFSTNTSIPFECIVDFMYQLYIRQDFLDYTNEEYKEIVNNLSQQYHFSVSDFINLYKYFYEKIL